MFLSVSDFTFHRVRRFRFHASCRAYNMPLDSIRHTLFLSSCSNSIFASNFDTPSLPVEWLMSKQLITNIFLSDFGKTIQSQRHSSGVSRSHELTPYHDRILGTSFCLKMSLKRIARHVHRIFKLYPFAWSQLWKSSMSGGRQLHNIAAFLPSKLVEASGTYACRSISMLANLYCLPSGSS